MTKKKMTSEYTKLEKKLPFSQKMKTFSKRNQYLSQGLPRPLIQKLKLIDILNGGNDILIKIVKNYSLIHLFNHRN